MSRTSLLIGFLAGGWFATLLIVFLPSLGLIAPAQADGDDGAPPPNAMPNTNPLPIPLPGLTNPGGTGAGAIAPDRLSGPSGRGIPNPGGGTSDSNNRAIALSASNGGGEAIVYYFDTVAQRVLVYQYKGLLQGNKPLNKRDKGGLRLLAARHMDFDLRLQGYRDLSERTRNELRDKWESVYGSDKKAKKTGILPTKTVKAK